MLCDCEFFAKVRCELLCSSVQSSHFTVNVSSKMVAGVVWCPVPWSWGVQGNISMLQWVRTLARLLPLTHPHQMAASSPPALYHQVETHHCHLLICSYTLKMLMCCMHEIFIYEGRRYDGYSFYLELWKPWGFHLILDIWHIFTGKHAGCWLISQDLLSPSLGAYFEIIMHLVQL